jgi:hypothetical protein
VRRAAPKVCSRRPGPTFYSPNLALLYVHYDGIAQNYPGWNLTEIKGMAARERQHWISLIKWRMDRSA